MTCPHVRGCLCFAMLEGGVVLNNEQLKSCKSDTKEHEECPFFRKMDPRSTQGGAPSPGD